MSSEVKLNPNAEKCLQLMHLKEADQPTMRELIGKYTTKKVFTQDLSLLVAKSELVALQQQNNNIKRAQAMIQRRAVEIAVETGLIEVRASNAKEQAALKDKVFDNTEYHAFGFVRFCIQLNLGDSLPENLEILDLQNFVTKFVLEYSFRTL